MKYTLFLLLASSLFSQYSVTVIDQEKPQVTDYLPAQTYTQEDWEGFGSLQDFLSSLPAFRSQFGYSSLKGFTENGYARFATFINGQKISPVEMQPFPLGSLSLGSVERIEIIQSSASTLAGDGALAGGINIVLKNEGEYRTLALEGDSRLGYKGTLSLGDPFWGYWNIGWQNQEAQRENSRSTLFHLDGNRRWHWGGVQGLYSFSQGKNPGSITSGQFEANPNQSNNPEDFFRDHVGNLGLDWDYLEGQNLRYSLVYRAGGYDTTSQGSFTTKERYQQELSAQGRMEGEGLAFLYNAGGNLVFYNYQSFANMTQDTLNNEMNFLRLDGGVGAALEWRPLDPWKIRFSGRWDGLYLLSDGTIPDARGENTEGALAYALDLQWHGEDASLHLNLNRGFRFPLLDEQVSFWGFGTDYYNPLEPEESWEAALRAEGHWEMVGVQGSAFVLALEKEIALNEFWVNENIAESLRWGAEAAIQVQLGFLEIGGGYSFLQAFQEGQEIQELAPHKGDLYFQFFPLENWSIRPRGTYSSPFRSLGNPVPGRWDLGVHTSLSFLEEDLVLSLTLDNLLNDRTPSVVYFGGYYPEEGFRASLSAQWNLP